MDIISQRVAAGLDVKPKRKARKPKGKSQGDAGDGHKAGDTQDTTIDWKKWGDRTAMGRHWVGQGKRIITGQEVLYTLNIVQG
jgi:hypothetical protein